MGILTDLTYLHMETFTTVDRIERQLARLKRLSSQPDQGLRVVDQIASEALRLRRNLVAFFAREEKELFPRVQRIFGSDVEELSELREHQRQVLSRLDQFIVEVTGEEELNGSAPVEHYEELFDSFVTRYERRCDMERHFYRTYSTILYPGGLATE